MTAWFESAWSSVDRLSRWILLGNVGIAVSILSTFCLTAFVIGAGIRKDALQKIEDSKKDEIIAQTNQLAATANLQASQANVKFGESVLKQKELDLQINQSLVEQELLHKNNIELQSQLEKERAAREQLQEQVGFRTITEEQSNALVSAFKQIPNATINIRATNSSNESSQFAEKLRDIFIASGWKAGPVFYNMVLGRAVEKGVVLVVESNRSALGVLIQQAFVKQGIELKAAIDPKVPADTAVIVVGQKPE